MKKIKDKKANDKLHDYDRVKNEGLYFWSNPTLNFFKSTVKVLLKTFASAQNRLKFDTILLNTECLQYLFKRYRAWKHRMHAFFSCQVKHYSPFLESINPENFDTIQVIIDTQMPLCKKLMYKISFMA